MNFDFGDEILRYLLLQVLFMFNFISFERLLTASFLTSVHGLPIYAIIFTVSTQLNAFSTLLKERLVESWQQQQRQQMATKQRASICFGPAFGHSLRDFLAHNVAYLRLLADGNRVYGQSVYLFFLVAYPENAYLLMRFLFKNHSTSAWVAVSVLIPQQLFLMFAIQLFAARMAVTFHRPVKPMMTIFQELNQNFSNCSTRVFLKVSTYLQHFHMNNRYGIALYGKVGTTTYASYFKSVVFYMKFLVFAYKLFATEK